MEKKAMAYLDFPEIFELARGETLFVSGKDAKADESDALAWVACMAEAGEDFNQVGQVWLGSCCSDTGGEAMITPLACAVNNGMPKTAEALLAMGADPLFRFVAYGERRVVGMGLMDLVNGCSDTATRSWECEGIVRAALEAKDIGKSLAVAAQAAGKGRVRSL